MTIQERHSIERYLRGDLSGVELEEFKKLMAGDESFRDKIETQEKLHEAIDIAWRKQQQEKIISQINYRTPLVPTGLKLILVFFVVLVGTISLWFYTGRQTTRLTKPILSLFTKNGKKVEKIASARVAAPKTSTGEQTESEPIQTDSLIKDSTVTGNETINEEEVKQDKVLTTMTITVIDVSDKESKEDNLAANAVKKLNPEAELSAEEKKSNDYVVEYWMSPVNYEGYKMSKNKIILFGIENPDGVTLYRLNDIVYMNYLKVFYKLENTLDFKPYQKLKEPEIPAAIK